MIRKRLIQVIVLTVLASWLPDIVMREVTGTGSHDLWIRAVKVVLLTAVGFWWFRKNGDRGLSRYSFLLAVIVISEMLVRGIEGSLFWRSLFDYRLFVQFFSSSILLKVIGIIPVTAALLLFFTNPKDAYLVPGNWNAGVSEIRWLSIKENSISWGRLSLISAVLIALGTLLLTLITVTGFSLPTGIEKLPGMLPVIVLFALINSFCEGIVYRNAVLGGLRNILPKGQGILVAAAFFGIAHYHGAPGGILGVFMSGLLGWYMCRSMYESGGFLPPWIIHFFQDVVIFTTIFLLGGFAI